MVRDHMLTNKFSLTEATGGFSLLDSYFAAFRIPDLLYSLLVLGTISTVFIPVFTGMIHKNKDEAWEVTSTVINLVIFILIGLSFALFIFVPYLIKYFTVGFGPEAMQTTVNLTRIMLLSPLIFGLSAVASSILNSFKRFIGIALAPIFYNLGIIAGIVFLAPIYGIYGVAIGVLIGALGHLLVQLPMVYRCGFKYVPSLKVEHPKFKKMAKLVVPRVLALSANQINLLFDTFLGSTLIAGSIAIFHLAQNLQSLPVGVVGISVAVSTFSTFAELAIEGDLHKFCRQLSKMIRSVLFLIIPASVGMILLRTELVRLILGSGKFNWTDTILTANTLGYFCIGLFAVSLTPLIARAFYSHQDTVTPLICSFITVVLNIGLALLFTKGMNFGVAGMALAFSLSAIVGFTILTLCMHQKMRGHISLQYIFYNSAKILFCSIVMAGFVQVTKSMVGDLVNMQTFVGVLIKTMSAVGVGVISYGMVAHMIRCEELVYILSRLRLLPRSSSQAGSAKE